MGTLEICQGNIFCGIYRWGIFFVEYFLVGSWWCWGGGVDVRFLTFAEGDGLPKSNKCEQERRMGGVVQILILITECPPNAYSVFAIDTSIHLRIASLRLILTKVNFYWNTITFVLRCH